MSMLRTTLATGFAASVLAVMATPVAAHVTVSPEQATPGGVAHVVFRMPNESDTAATVELAVHFPEETPIPSARTRPVPGWTVQVERTTLDHPVAGPHGETINEAVTSITWTADGEDTAIQPGEYGEFPVEIGPLPEAEELFFRALQTYSDGVVARWIELPEDGTEPGFPAPSLRLAEPGTDPVSQSASNAEQANDDPAPAEDSGAAPTWLALAGLFAGLAGLALGGVAFLRTRG